MMRALGIFLACFFSVNVFASKAYVAGQNHIHEAVREDALRAEIEYLTTPQLKGRATGTPEGVMTLGYVMDVFRRNSLEPIAQPIVVDEKVCGHNILGFFHGNRKHPGGKYVVVMAYADGLGLLKGKLYPGADANASGLVAMLTLARMFPLQKLLTGEVFSKNVIFVALDGHNKNLSGAKALYQAFSDGGIVDPKTGAAVTLDKVDLVVNIDQVGSSLAPIREDRPDHLILLGSKTLTKDERAMIQKVNWFYLTGLDLGYNYYGSDNFTRLFERLSDQRPFVDAGKRYLLATSGITNNTNKTTDTVETLNIPVLRRRIIFLFRVIEKLIS